MLEIMGWNIQVEIILHLLILMTGLILICLKLCTIKQSELMQILLNVILE